MEIAVSFSGGKSSAMMCWLLENHEDYKHLKKHYVFANTGREMPATIIFAKRWMNEYLGVKLNVIEAKVYHDLAKSTGYNLVDWQNLSMDGKPYEEVVKKYGLPSISFPHCSRELKQNPIKAFIREHLGLKNGDYVQALGMRYDEPRRVKPNTEFTYPLWDKKVTKSSVLEFFESDSYRKNFYNLDIEEFEGNCDFCFKKSHSKLMKMFAKHPQRFLWWDNLQEKYYKGNDEIFRGKKLSRQLLRDGFENKAEQLVAEKNFDCSCGKDWE